MSALLAGPGAPEVGGFEALRSRRLALLGPRLFDFVPLLREVGAEVVMVCESGPDADGLAAAAGARLISPETRARRRAQRLNSDVDELAPQLSELAAMTGGGRTGPAAPLSVLAYGVTDRWEQATAATCGRVKLVAPPAALKARIDDKIETRRQLGRLGIATPAHARVAMEDLDFRALTGRFGRPFVLQRPVGASGVGTFRIDGAADLDEMRRQACTPWWLASTFLAGPVVNIHGLVGADGVSVSPPSIQLSGVPGLGPTAASYNGNDFGAARDLDPAVGASVDRSTAEIGLWLSGLGYVGTFGVDFIASGSEAFALEVNPRVQGSTWLLGELERAGGRTPLLLRHFLELFGQPVSHDGAEGPPPAGAYLIMRWCGSAPVRIDGHPRPGIHAVRPGGQLEFRRPGIGLLECAPDEIVITGLPPVDDAVVEPGAPLARVASWSRLGAADGHSLTEEGRRIAAAVLGGFGGLPPSVEPQP